MRKGEKQVDNSVERETDIRVIQAILLVFWRSTPLIYELLMGILLQMRGTGNNFFLFPRSHVCLFRYSFSSIFFQHFIPALVTRLKFLLTITKQMNKG